MSAVVEAGEDVLELLLEEYAGATAARAYWSWAGGEAHEVPLPGDAGEVWQTLWERAAEPGCAVSRVALVRELLFDQPGHPVLLEFLASTAAASHPELLEQADLLLVCLERLRPLRFELGWLRAYLAAFRSPSWEAALAAFAPALHEWGWPADRERLIAACAQLAELTRAVLRLERLRAELREVAEAGDPARDAERAAAAMVELATLRDGLADAEGAYGRGMHRRLRDLVKRLEFRRAPNARAIGAGLSSALLSVRKLGGPEGERLWALAEGLRVALLGTRAAEPE